MPSNFEKPNRGERLRGNWNLKAIAFRVALAGFVTLLACVSPSSIRGNLTTPQYAAGSARLAAFNLLNQQRQQCGFPAFQDNAYLDQAANAHARYEQSADEPSDTEVFGRPGFTGQTYADRAVHFGFPSGLDVGGVGAGFTDRSTTEALYGQALVYAWLSGVYHLPPLMEPATDVGVGEVDSTSGGTATVWGSMSFANLQSMTTNSPLTFPCQGTTGVAFEGVTENPKPPDTSGLWGTPIGVMGNPTDTIVLRSGTVTDMLGHIITLRLLYSANDPNKELQSYAAVAYPPMPLSPNTQYMVSITGVVNGVAFSRSFSFTTGDIVQ
ncbi:CAP domain-containing protein [Trinickia fusca]|uniref:CAP domain-containing protein n=1 Tax=Trinickia fusca TaxID=2419777 RepID=A0A494WZ41_9BURK|nr:CAP domain-containing protein [Trinickia fusca]RKP43390.1 CAP domain-containing protein [Trinickia fusca]